MDEREPRAALPPRSDAEHPEANGMSHEQLIAALRAVDGLVDVSHDPPNFQFRGRPFLHFHADERGTYADVRLGNGDFEPVWASTPRERIELLARVCDHVEQLQHSKKSDHRRAQRGRERPG
jgi:hypothetical protein